MLARSHSDVVVGGRKKFLPSPRRLPLFGGGHREVQVGSRKLNALNAPVATLETPGSFLSGLASDTSTQESELLSASSTTGATPPWSQQAGNGLGDGGLEPIPAESSTSTEADRASRATVLSRHRGITLADTPAATDEEDDDLFERMFAAPKKPSELRKQAEDDNLRRVQDLFKPPSGWAPEATAAESPLVTEERSCDRRLSEPARPRADKKERNSLVEHEQRIRAQAQHDEPYVKVLDGKWISKEEATQQMQAPAAHHRGDTSRREGHPRSSAPRKSVKTVSGDI